MIQGIYWLKAIMQRSIFSSAFLIPECQGQKWNKKNFQNIEEFHITTQMHLWQWIGIWP